MSLEASSPPVPSYDTWPVIAHVETDRYCDYCGYNLNTQVVRRDPDLQLLLVRCPECGRLHPAGELLTSRYIWFRRWALSIAIVWIIILLGLLILLTIMQGALCRMPLEVLSGWDKIMTATGEKWVRQPQLDAELKVQVYFWGGLGSVTLGGLMGLLAVVCCYHLRRSRYYLFFFVWALLIGGVIVGVWRSEEPQLLIWGLPHILRQSLIYLIGAVAAIIWGRAFARWMLTIILPPKIRQVMSFLWLVDGLPPPAIPAAGEKEATSLSSPA
ncbi:MAG: hypothetical protein HJJLKODD_00868 [Phycisphaerae bacterium]|nr:hypothetical protein [Phycisphaerae bacterium]